MIGEDAIQKEDSIEATEYGNYMTAKDLMAIEYSDDEIAQQLGLTSKQFIELIEKFDGILEENEETE